MTRDASDDGSRYGDTGGSGHKIVHSETDHLREIGHGRFPGITLPVRVRGKANCRVECEVISDRLKRFRILIERQETLQTQDSVSKQDRDHSENQQRDSILKPGLFLVRIDAQEPISELFYRFDHWI